MHRGHEHIESRVPDSPIVLTGLHHYQPAPTPKKKSSSTKVQKPATPKAKPIPHPQPDPSTSSIRPLHHHTHICRTNIFPNTTQPPLHSNPLIYLLTLHTLLILNPLILPVGHLALPRIRSFQSRSPVPAVPLVLQYYEPDDEAEDADCGDEEEDDEDDEAAFLG